MKLIVSLTSPYARKIRVVLAEKDLPFEQEVDIPWVAQTRVPESNPLGKVPVLVADDGAVWFDSPVIAEYLETLGGPELLPADRAASLPVRLTESLADGIIDAAVAAYFEARRVEPQQDPEAIERQVGKIRRGLAALEARAVERLGFNGDTLTLGDIAVGCMLGYLDLRFSHLGWRHGHPELTALAGKLFARPSFIATVPPAA
ncbi:MAG: glutathione S-transferase [Zoogloea sp.]|nr:glutathione S-transferase [Zoogloea sp.]